MTQPKTPTRRQKVLDLLMDGNWHTTMEVNAVDVGGSEGTRRVREIRNLIRAGKLPNIYKMQVRKSKAGTQYEYRLLKIVRTPRQAGWKPGDQISRGCNSCAEFIGCESVVPASFGPPGCWVPPEEEKKDVGIPTDGTPEGNAGVRGAGTASQEDTDGSISDV